MSFLLRKSGLPPSSVDADLKETRVRVDVFEKSSAQV